MQVLPNHSHDFKIEELLNSLNKRNPGSYNFAANYSTEDFRDKKRITEFLFQFLYWEGKYNQPEIAYNEHSGLTYDGHYIDTSSGELVGKPRNWSAASKESLHIGLLALAILDKNPGSRLIISPDRPSGATKLAIQILERKIRSYERFNKEYPGYGGFLPWFSVSDKGLKPCLDWVNRVPGLDNGELGWSIYLAYNILRDKGYTKLSNRYKAWFDLMIKNIVLVFYNGDGRIRAESKIRDTSLKPAENNYTNNIKGYYLDDPYEGELMAFLITLFGDLNRVEKNKIWKLKQSKLISIEYKTPKGILTVAKGHWFSAHEKWGYFVLPYTNIPLVKQIFINGEKARTWNSAKKLIPGIFASVNARADKSSSLSYFSGLGIQEIANQKILREDIVTPYASFPIFLTNSLSIGFSWLNIMLKYPKMQNKYGTAESINLTNKDVTPLLTWDSKMITVIALLGGFQSIMGEYLRREGKYDLFYQITKKYFTRSFGHRIKGKKVPFRIPFESKD